MQNRLTAAGPIWEAFNTIGRCQSLEGERRSLCWAAAVCNSVGASYFRMWFESN
jgi:hypothetical protein